MHMNPRMLKAVQVVAAGAITGILLLSSYFSYQRYHWEGAFSVVLGITVLLLCLASLRWTWVTKLKGSAWPQSLRISVSVNKNFHWSFFVIASVVFLIVFPFSIFLHAIGLIPGLVFISVFSFLWAGLNGE